MPGATNWESKETWERVVASIIASGVKLDLRAIALYYGTTYDTIENRLRKIKKDAIVLKQEVESGQRTELAPALTKSAPSTPRKPKTPKKDALTAVANGRISKASPSKKQTIKLEHMAGKADSLFGDVMDSKEEPSNHSFFDMEDDDSAFHFD